MLIKVDIEKAFDTIVWNAILATPRKMKFPPIWITWVQECISSPYFSFIINGHHSAWFPSSRGLMLGDPLSPLLFNLVTQNLTAILNHALSLTLAPGFDHHIRRNFNHLMFADDLLLITNASR